MLKYSALVALALVLNSPEYSGEHIPGHHTGLKRLQHRIVNVNVEVNLPQHHCNKKHQQKQQQKEQNVPKWLKEEANVMDVQLADLGPDQPLPSQEQQQVQPQQAPEAPVVAPADTQQQQQQQQQPQQQQKKKKKKKKRGFNIGGIINGIQKGIQVIDQLKGIGNVFGGSTSTDAAAAAPATTNEAEIDSAVDAQFDEESTTEDTTTSKPNFLSHIMDFFSSGKATQLMDHVKNIFSLFNNQGSSAEIDDAVAEFNSASLDLHDYINSPSNSAEDLHALEVLAKHFLFNVDSKLLLEPSDSDEAETAYLKRDYSEYEWNLLARAQQETDIQQIEGKIHEAWINGQKDQLTALKIALHDAIAKISVAKLDRPTVGATVNSAAELDDAEDSNGGGNFFSKALGFLGKAGQLMDHVKNIFSIFHSGNDQSAGNQAEIDSAIDENIAQFDDGEPEEVPNAEAETPTAPAAPAATPRKHPLSRIFDFFGSGKATQLLEHVKNIFSIFHKQGSSAELDDATADFDSVSEDLHESINSPINSVEDLHSLEIVAKHFLFNIDQKLLQEPSSADEAETSYLRKDYSEYEWNLLSEAQQQPEILEIESKIHQAWINGEKDQLTAVKIALHNAIAKISVAKLKKTE